jgi:hypothetical protein
MKVAKVIQTRVTPFKHGVPKVLCGFGSNANTQNLTFDKLKVWKLT